MRLVNLMCFFNSRKTFGEFASSEIETKRGVDFGRVGGWAGARGGAWVGEGGGAVPVGLLAGVGDAGSCWGLSPESVLFFERLLWTTVKSMSSSSGTCVLEVEGEGEERETVVEGIGGEGAEEGIEVGGVGLGVEEEVVGEGLEEVEVRVRLEVFPVWDVCAEAGVAV